MRKSFLAPLVLLMLSCHNTNPDQGSGGNKVDQQTTLSSHAIVDSTKAIIDQSLTLEIKRSKGEISETSFAEKNRSLMGTYKVLFQSLSPSDTLIITAYKQKRMQEILKDSTKSEKSQRWQ